MKKKKVVIVVPTYNEAPNIERLLDTILMVKKSLKNSLLSVLVVDDSSPDGTATLVKKYTKTYKNIFLISGKKQGLGVAYIRGFRYAMKELKADIIFEMDADFSHNPNDIPRFIHEIENGSDFVIGSRYIKEGRIPEKWSLLRKLNSQWGNIFARHIANLGTINDCTGGYRAITGELLKKINLENLQVKGYAFQISLLWNAIYKNAKVKEIPIIFIDREAGDSKIRVSDIKEFILYVFFIRFTIIKNKVAMYLYKENKTFLRNLRIKLQFEKEINA